MGFIGFSGFGVWGWGFGDSFTVRGSGFRVYGWGLGFRVQGSGPRIPVSFRGVREQGIKRFGLRVRGVGLRV